jgi:hypothetical protein
MEWVFAQPLLPGGWSGRPGQTSRSNAVRRHGGVWQIYEADGQCQGLYQTWGRSH